MTAPKRPSPERGGIAEEFWAAVDEGRLVLQECGACGKIRYPVNSICPSCLSDEYSWAEMSGAGEVHSTIVFHQVYNEAFRQEVPYNVSVIQLDEGPRIMSNVVDVEPDRVAVGDRVRVRFDKIDDFALPRFVLDPADSHG